MRSSSISLDGCGSKIRKVTRRIPAVPDEPILATSQNFFFTKRFLSSRSVEANGRVLF